ncbi:ribosome assembly RNA-binding protein YhbY [Limosilactobacillus caecicola]|uniref:ribosome assembly RNA-binding protein YhbY n=1 Tax=Limosilactobacillus caecicola TaxID=2941332 RepID=UPI00203B6A23|nr:ribosome assembly RNA-binding protein YhbY [Limosilactobacillus caecicola]
MKLRGKQKRYLRAQATHFQPIFSIGKNGLTPEWLAQLDGALNRRELIKINILQNAVETTSEVKDYIEVHSDIDVVQTIGHVLVLFKESDQPEFRNVSARVKKI